jgi:hypothetical protein
MRKTKVKFNLMDALVLALIALCILALLYIFVWSEQRSSDNLGGTPSTRVSYLVEITGIFEEYVDKINVGDAPIDSSKKTALGVITALETRPYIYTGTNLHDGTMVLSTVEDYVSMYITIEADALPAGYGYTVNGGEIYVGKLVHLGFPDIVCSGYCIAMDIRS